MRYRIPDGDPLGGPAIVRGTVEREPPIMVEAGMMALDWLV